MTRNRMMLALLECWQSQSDYRAVMVCDFVAWFPRRVCD